jgi:protein TonB
VPLQADSVALQRGGGSPQPGAPVSATAPQPGQRVGGPAPVAPPSPPAIGLLERSAKPITPENPIPRRTYSVPVELPAGASDQMRIVISLRATIDQQGRVAELRRIGPAPLPPAVQPYAEAAIAAVRQWQYDPPAEGPISFNVTVSFAGATPPRADQTAGPPLLSGLLEETITVTPARPNVGFGGTPVRVGGAIRQPAKTRHVNPEYPPIAQSSRVQGVVILEAVIGDDGRIVDTRVLRSIPLLDQAALDAVRQWEFTPTMLNGQPVPVIMTVTVQFTLPNEQ